MASNVLKLRMKFREYSIEKLNNVINNEDSSEDEIRIAKELLERKGGKAAPAPTPKKKTDEETVVAKGKKSAPKKAAVEESVEEAPADEIPAVDDGEQLTDEERNRLEKAETKFDNRQKNRKTPSKSDKKMEVKEKKEKVHRETKRENLEESEEMPGLKLGTKVTLKGESTVGEITRLYRSSDGKEKCMVKFGETKPIKKRVTALEMAEETKAAPAKKSPSKKK